jgi:hypothetical protein
MAGPGDPEPVWLRHGWQRSNFRVKRAATVGAAEAASFSLAWLEKLAASGAPTPLLQEAGLSSLALALPPIAR